MNEIKPANKREVTAVCESLNEENERLTRKVRALERELKGYRQDESIWKRMYEHCMWWYDFNCADTVNKALKIILLTVAGLSVIYYVLASIGMEFAPNITEPVTIFIKRLVRCLMPW